MRQYAESVQFGSKMVACILLASARRWCVGPRALLRILRDVDPGVPSVASPHDVVAQTLLDATNSLSLASAAGTSDDASGGRLVLQAAANHALRVLPRFRQHRVGSDAALPPLSGPSNDFTEFGQVISHCANRSDAMHRGGHASNTLPDAARRTAIPLVTRVAMDP